MGNQQSSKISLISIKDLFINSFKIYQQRFWIFVKLMAISALVFLFALFIWISLFLSILFGKNFYTFIVLSIVFTIFIVMAAVVGFWVQASLIVAVKERASLLGAKQSLLKGWSIINSYIWVSFLTGLTILLGFIFFIIPGLIFTIWFGFSRYVLISEDKRGKSAMIMSRQLVRGYWWSIFGRFLVTLILGIFISYVPLLGPLINLFFTIAFIIIYDYLIYEDLKKIKG